MKSLLHGLVFIVAQILVAYLFALFVPEDYFNLMMFSIFFMDFMFILYLITRPVGRREYYFFKKDSRYSRFRLNIAFGKEHFNLDFKVHSDCWVNMDYPDEQREQINRIWGIRYSVLPRIRIVNKKLKFISPDKWDSRYIGFSSNIQENSFMLYLVEHEKGEKSIHYIGAFSGDSLITVNTMNLIQTMRKEINPIVSSYMYPRMGKLPAHRPQAIFLNILY